jgi:hypothetical protein
VILMGEDGSLSFSLKLAALIDSLHLEVPSEVEVGEEFKVVPQVSLAGGAVVSLRGPKCGVRYEVTNQSVRKIDQDGRAVAMDKGTAGVVVKYEGKMSHAEVRVK